MDALKILFLSVIVIFFSNSVLAKNNALLSEVKNEDGSVWIIEKSDEGYNLKYTNTKGEVFCNSKIITSSIEENSLYLDATSTGGVSLVMAYPRDSYIFNFSSEYTPSMISACKEITLPSTEQQHAAVLLTLCTKKQVLQGMTLANADTESLLASNNLMLSGNFKTLIGSEKSYLYNENKIQKRGKPYLIKGDVVEVQGYENSMLKIKYVKKSKVIVAWIKFVDIL